jgi:hypothetical protein
MSDTDEEAAEYVDDNTNDDEEYLHSIKIYFRKNDFEGVNRIDEAKLVFIRNQRIKELKMWSFIRKVSTYGCFLAVLYTITYSNLNPDGFNQVNHLQKFILNTRKIDDYWNWLENSFVENTHAQQWYNGDPPRNLSGYMNDKTNRLIGWISNQTTPIYNSSIRMDKSRNKSGGT